VLGKKRSYRAIDEPANQYLALRGTPLPLEKATRNLTGSIGVFTIVAGQWQKIEIEFRLPVRACGRENHCVAALY
jgi:hypothetical protein